jgi:hypothetical protein
MADTTSGDQATVAAFEQIRQNLRKSRIGGHTGDVEYLNGLCRSYIGEDGQRLPDTTSPEALTNAIRDKMAGLVRDEVNDPRNPKRNLYYLLDPAGNRLVDTRDRRKPREVAEMRFLGNIHPVTGKDEGTPFDKYGKEVNCQRKVPGLRVLVHITDGNYPQITYHYKLDVHDYNDVEFSPKHTKIHGTIYQNPNTTDRAIDPKHVRTLQTVVIPWTNGTYGEDYEVGNGLTPSSLFKDMRKHHGNAGVYHRHERDVKIMTELGNANDQILNHKQIRTMHQWADGDLTPSKAAPIAFNNLAGGGQWELNKQFEIQPGVMFTDGGKCMVINSQKRHVVLEKIIGIDTLRNRFYNWREEKRDNISYWMEKFERQPMGTLITSFINFGSKNAAGRPSMAGRMARGTLRTVLGENITSMHKPPRD